MNKILLIGAGQLGSRHLQGLARSTNQLEIYVVDPSEKNLEISINRFQEIEGYKNHIIDTYADISFLKERQYFLAIIATNADIRYKLTKQLLDSFQIKSIIFEKVVFQSEKQFQDINYLLSEADINGYINCPRRMWPSYHELKDLLKNYEKIEMSVSGIDWGMACNSLHFIDLISFLTDDAEFKVTNSNLINKLFFSKREGFIEFNGEFQLSSTNGNVLNIKCDPKSNPEEKPSQHISLIFGENRVEIYESLQTIEYYRQGKKVKSDSFTILYQSGLSNQFVDELINNNTCNLTCLEESAKFHLLLFNIFKEKYLQITGEKIEELQIT